MKEMNKTILVVDDDPYLREVLAEDLASFGYEVGQAANGLEALELLKKKNFAMVISDVRMPEMNGIELLQSIREKSSEMPVFMFVTGFTEMSLEDAYHKGASALFSKPFNRRNLLRMIEKTLTFPEYQAAMLKGICTDFGVQMSSNEKQKIWNGRMSYISEGMMYIRTDDTPNVGEHMNFTILFDNLAPWGLSGEGVVKQVYSVAQNAHSNGCTIEFLKLNENQNPELLSLVKTFQQR